MRQRLRQELRHPNSRRHENQQTKPRGSVLHRGSRPLPLASGVDRGERVDGVLMNFSRRGMARLGRAGLGEAWRGNTPACGRYHRIFSLGEAWYGEVRRGGAGLGGAIRLLAGGITSYFPLARHGRARRGRAGLGKALRFPMSGIIGQFSVKITKHNETNKTQTHRHTPINSP